MNLRKDHYRRSGRRPRGRTGGQSNCRGARRCRWGLVPAALRAPKGLSTHGKGRSGAPWRRPGSRVTRAGTGPSPRRRADRPLEGPRPRKRGAPWPVRRGATLCLFFCLRFPLAAGSRPRRGGPRTEQQNTQASPDGEDWPPRGYPANSLSLLRREAGGSMTPGLGLRPGSTGAPGGRRPRKKTQTPRSRTQGDGTNRKSTTLSGGSLGSCVDEERS